MERRAGHGDADDGAVYRDQGRQPDSLLFYRMGDFYELFFEDAEIASRALGIVLTKRGKHQGLDIPMCGVPVHAADDYLQKLIAAGFRVAVCEQIEDPAEARKRGAKSVVRRDVDAAGDARHHHRGQAARAFRIELSDGARRGSKAAARRRLRARLDRDVDRRLPRRRDRRRSGSLPTSSGSIRGS